MTPTFTAPTLIGAVLDLLSFLGFVGGNMRFPRTKGNVKKINDLPHIFFLHDLVGQGIEIKDSFFCPQPTWTRNLMQLLLNIIRRVRLT